jgi:hypothetical protein
MTIGARDRCTSPDEPTTYVISGLVDDGGTPVTFDADDGEADKLNLRSLLRGATRRVDSPGITYRFEEPATDGDWREQDKAQAAACEFARDELTSSGELAEPFVCDADHEPYLCEACLESHRIARASDEDQDYGLLADCKRCDANLRTIDARMRLLELGVAVWIKSRWPELPIDGERWCVHDGGFQAAELSTAVRGLIRLPTAGPPS